MWNSKHAPKNERAARARNLEPHNFFIYSFPLVDTGDIQVLQTILTSKLAQHCYWVEKKRCTSSGDSQGGRNSRHPLPPKKCRRQNRTINQRMEVVCQRSFLLYATEIAEFPSVTSLPMRSRMQLVILKTNWRFPAVIWLRDHWANTLFSLDFSLNIQESL